MKPKPEDLSCYSMQADLSCCKTEGECSHILFFKLSIEKYFLQFFFSTNLSYRIFLGEETSCLLVQLII